MANIQHWLEQIRRAIYGREVRSSIADAIEAINKNCGETEIKQEQLEGTFNQLIINAGNSNAEVVAARVKADGTQFKTLSERLNKNDEEVSNLSANIDSVKKEVIEARTDKDGFDHGRLKTRIDNIDLKVDDIPKQFNSMAQSSRPPKQGLIKSTHKIIYKVSDSEYRIVQCANKQYILYVLKKEQGGTGATDTGGTWELTRLQQVTKVSDAYVWWYADPIEGAVTTGISPSVTNGEEHNYLVNGTDIDRNSIFSSQGQNGIGVYSVEPSTRASWNFECRAQKKVTLMMYCKAPQSQNLEILVNDMPVLNVDMTKHGNDSTQYISFIDIPIPYTKQTSTVKITLNNKDSVNKARFYCFNFKKLKEYDGETINNFKVFPTLKHFINGKGANDYAINDKDTGKWVGSYHGGDILEEGYCTYNNCKGNDEEFNYSTSLHLIQDRTFWVGKNFEFYQRTNLNNKAKMTTILDFSMDGTVEMRFGLHNSAININTLYTALTCTNSTFDYLKYPYMIKIADNIDPSSRLNIYGVVDGMISQYDSNNGLELVSRFTQFSTGYMSVGNQIWNTASYNKHYYAIVKDFKDGIVIPNLSWSKGLDFIIH